MSASCLTPPQLAERYGVSPAKVIGWIQSGELRAFDASMTAGKGRPRWRIPPEAIAEFEARRSAKPPTPRVRRRRRSARKVRQYIT